MSTDQRERDRIGEIASLCAIATAQVLAETLTSTIETAGTGRRALTESQKAQMIECALLAFDGHRHRLLEQLTVDEQIRQATATGPTLVPIQKPDWTGA